MTPSRHTDSRRVREKTLRKEIWPRGFSISKIHSSIFTRFFKNLRKCNLSYNPQTHICKMSVRVIFDFAISLSRCFNFVELFISSNFFLSISKFKLKRLEKAHRTRRYEWKDAWGSEHDKELLINWINIVRSKFFLPYENISSFRFKLKSFIFRSLLIFFFFRRN